MADSKKHILSKFAIVYIMIFIGFIGVIVRIGYLQVVEGEFWENKSKQRYVQMQDVKAKRGNIYAIEQDSDELLLLATDVPLYDAYIDLGYEYRTNKKTREKEKVRVIDDEFYNSNISKLCDSLAVLFKDSKNPKSKNQYLSFFNQFRNQSTSNRYVLIQRDINFEQYERFKKFPLISREKKKLLREKKIIDGKEVETKRYIGTGNYHLRHFVHVEERNKRYYPYGSMARRTIGSEVRKKGCDTCYNGIDGYYSKYLSGLHGKRLEKKIVPSIWVPIDDKSQIKAVNGMDVVSTIDVRLQELAENSLRKCLDSNHAESGCVVLMEVKTGKVKAISNLSRISEGVYVENENIASTHLYESGSTFKTITTMMMLDKDMLDTNMMLPTYSKQYPGASKPIKDVGIINHGNVSFTRAMQMSSNVAFSQLVYDNYIAKNKRKQLAIDLKEYFYFDKLNIDLELYEPKPYINEKALSVDDILRLGFGYVSVMTPLQLLTFYNAIANNGKMLRPLFVSEIMKDGKTFKKFEPVVIKESICKPKTLKAVQNLLEKVVLYGTARRLKSSDYGIAGKTGTAEIGYDNKQNQLQHRASFVGYFPVEDPQYSCIVVISKPQKSRTHGGDLAAPVFKDLSDRVVGTMINSVKHDNRTQSISPLLSKGNQDSYLKFCKNINAKPKIENTLNRNIVETSNIMPNVIGMSARDAVFELERLGLLVKLEGRGKVIGQSIGYKAKIKKSDKIILRLSSSGNLYVPEKIDSLSNKVN